MVFPPIRQRICGCERYAFCFANDAVRARIVEQEEPETDRPVAHLAVPDAAVCIDSGADLRGCSAFQSHRFTSPSTGRGAPSRLAHADLVAALEALLPGRGFLLFGLNLNDEVLRICSGCCCTG